MPCRYFYNSILLLLSLLLFRCSHPASEKGSIDRFALVTRHNVMLHEVDTLGSLTVGNGEFAFTADVTGLQTFYKEYENGIPLGTQSQWGWHRMPDPEKYTLGDVNVLYESCDNRTAPYPVQHDEGRAGKATHTLRSNPHRLHLGLVGLKLLKQNGERIEISDLQNINQKLDLWNGNIESKYEVEGIPVTVLLYAHPVKDQIAVKIRSPLIAENRLQVEFKFPYGKECHVCPGYNFENGDKHSSILTSEKRQATIKRKLDSTVFDVKMAWNEGELIQTKAHEFELKPRQDEFEFSVLFTQDSLSVSEPFGETQASSIADFKKFWTTGGAVDFSDCTDPRARELERRVVLSQYLTKIQCSGSLPPQETGLTMNSWYGKFHMEMYWWHAAHFALWGREKMIERSMGWYKKGLPKAMATAKSQGYKGARWQKMTDPEGDESPSSVGAFIIWQQPHAIYIAELLRRTDSSEQIVRTYQDIVFHTADFMVSFLKKRNQEYHLCHPLIPAQEIFKAIETDNPTFELQYWYYALSVAQQWRSHAGLEPNPEWQDAISKLTPLPVKDTLYLPNSTTPDAYTDDQYRKDHPAVLAAYGFLPFNPRIDTTIMLNTLKNIYHRWDWPSTWGWDYPLVAMTATRLHQAEIAIDALLMDTQKNTYLVNGHNYQDKRLRLYLPGNGGLLAAIALMTAGWDDNTTPNPGFPKNGKWNVRWEGLKKMP